MQALTHALSVQATCLCLSCSFTLTGVHVQRGPQDTAGDGAPWR